MAKTMDLIQNEEIYQCFRMVMDQMEEAQKQACSELFLSLSKCTKKQLVKIGEFVDRYQQEAAEFKAELGANSMCGAQNQDTSTIYSILEKLAERRGLGIKWENLMLKTNGKTIACTDPDQRLIIVDTSLPDENANYAIASRLWAEMMDDPGYYKGLKPNKFKPSFIFADLLVDGINRALKGA